MKSEKVYMVVHRIIFLWH